MTAELKGPGLIRARLRELGENAGFRLVVDRLVAELERKRAELEKANSDEFRRLQGWIECGRFVLNLPKAMIDQQTHIIEDAEKLERMKDGSRHTRREV